MTPGLVDRQRKPSRPSPLAAQRLVAKSALCAREPPFSAPGRQARGLAPPADGASRLWGTGANSRKARPARLIARLVPPGPGAPAPIVPSSRSGLQGRLANPYLGVYPGIPSSPAAASNLYARTSPKTRPPRRCRKRPVAGPGPPRAIPREACNPRSEIIPSTMKFPCACQSVPRKTGTKPVTPCASQLSTNGGVSEKTLACRRKARARAWCLNETGHVRPSMGFHNLQGPPVPKGTVPSNRVTYRFARDCPVHQDAAASDPAPRRGGCP